MRPTLEGANVVRFIAAMMVVMFHVVHMPKLALPTELKFIANYGGFGVPLFYMLSAFALSYRYHGKLQTADQMRRFYNRRFWRIAPLFYAMMLYYVGYLLSVHGSPPTLSKIITSATFTFNLIPNDVAGFVFASWSIGVEMLFYAVFPVILLAVSNLARAVAAFILAVFIVALWTNAFAKSSAEFANFGSLSIFAHLHYFVGGMLTFFVWREIKWTPLRHRAFTAVAMVVLVGLVVSSVKLQQIFGKPVLTAFWAAGFSLLILGLSVQAVNAPLRLASRFGQASYSLYLLHPAIIALMMHAGVYVWIYAASPNMLLAFLGSLAVTTAVLFPLSLVTYKHIERRFYEDDSRARAISELAIGWPSFQSVRLLAAAGFVVALPVVWICLYVARFEFETDVIMQHLLLLSATLFILAATALLTHRVLDRPGRSVVRVFATMVGLLYCALAFIYAATGISNAIWGDTLSYRLVLSAMYHPNALQAFVPLDDARSKIMAVMATVLVVATLMLIFWSVRAVVQSLLAHERATGVLGSRRALAILSLMAVVSLGASVLHARDAAALRGEPVLGFLGYNSFQQTMGWDQARLAARLEDETSRRALAEAPVAGKGARNIVLIMSDALRADRMGLYGYQRPTTPTLSQLHQDGKLHKVDMALSTCSESFCGIASTLGSRPYHELADTNVRLHEALRRLGYRTHFFLSGDHRSWNYLFDYYGADMDTVSDYKSMGWKDANDDRNLLDSLQKVAAADGKPSFFFFFLMSTHISGTRFPDMKRYQPEHTDRMRLLTFWNELGGTARKSGVVVNSNRLGAEEITALNNRYDNGVEQADFVISRIFETLRGKGYLDNSVVAILGDHGEGLGEHDHIGHTRFLYQEDIRVPLLFYSPGPLQLKNTQFAIQSDVAPTLMDAAALPIPASWKGRSLLLPPIPRTTLHQTRRGKAPCFAAVDSSSLHKFIRCGFGTTKEREEFFDLKRDPHELRNLLPLSLEQSAENASLDRLRDAIGGKRVFNACKRFECVD